MAEHEWLELGPAEGARVEKDGELWTLVLVRTLPHAPAVVWSALTDPQQLAQWAPFDADRPLDTAGTAVRLTTVGAPSAGVSETTVVRADAHRLLQYNWGDREVRWELEALSTGTRLTLWAGIDRRFISMGAAGWHLCLAVLDRALSGQSLGRIVAGDALKQPGWQRLNREYATQFGVEIPAHPAKT